MSSVPCTNSLKPLPADDLRRVVEQVGDAWQMLHGKNVAITGAHGFVGRWLKESLEWKWEYARDIGIEVLGRGVEEWWPLARPDFIIHATTNGVGWQHVAAVARAAGAKMLLLSSGAVYKSSKAAHTELEHNVGLGVGHWHAGVGITTYGLDKITQERECRDVAVVARLFSFIGPGLRRHTGREFLEADPITVNDDGAVRSYLYASDMAAWLWRVLLLGQVGRAYNVGSGEAIKVADFANLCGESRMVNVVKRWNQELDKTGTYYVPNVLRVEQELGCRQTVELDDAIRRTLTWR